MQKASSQVWSWLSSWTYNPKPPTAGDDDDRGECPEAVSASLPPTAPNSGKTGSGQTVSRRPGRRCCPLLLLLLQCGAMVRCAKLSFTRAAPARCFRRSQQMTTGRR